MFSSSTSFAEWTKVGENVVGDTVFYVDVERIRKHDGYVYWWELSDWLEPDEYGTMSGKVYKQGDCKKFRYKWLSGTLHKGPMGGGIVSETSNTPDKEWKYPPPDSSGEIVLKVVCQYAR